ncbi:threonine/serine exporter family protein [Kitasatospora paracochleata]|uniref:threonine/serine ThrE exporter family protein n=1 Tax=Kitasatospora paracochleata TaxID=58354 RepID=UPI0038993404
MCVRAFDQARLDGRRRRRGAQVPKRGRPGGRGSAAGKRNGGGRPGADARPATSEASAPPAPRAPAAPADAPPTGGLLGPDLPPVDRPVPVPHALPPRQTEGLLVPAPTEEPAPAEPAAERPYARGLAQDTLTPEEWRAAGYTPSHGTAVPAALAEDEEEVPWPDRMRTLLRTPMVERPALERTPRELHPSAARNIPRILDLSLRIGELLLASGEAAEDVEAAMLGIAHAYRLDHCEPQVTFTLISISHQPSLIDAPITADRVVRRRTSDYTRLASVYRLVADITAGRVSVNDAYRRLAEIRRNRHPYPVWLLALASGLLAGAATFLVGGRVDGKAWLVFISAFTAAVAGDRLASAIARRGLPEFYQFVIAAMPAAVLGILLSFNELHLRGSVVITGGLFALLPGRALVAAVQDGLTGFYITAAARLLEVMYLIVGIVIGVMLVLYLGVNYNAKLRPDESLAGTVNPPVQLVAAILLSLAFAMLLQTDRSALAPVVLNTAIGWSTYGVLTNAQISPIVATGVAAGLVGLFGQLMARYRQASALPYVTAAIGPLMPGSALYLGMLAFAQGHANAGLVSVTRAAALAMALAIGVNLGGEVARLFLKSPGATERLAPHLLVPRRAAKRTRGF